MTRARLPLLAMLMLAAIATAGRSARATAALPAAPLTPPPAAPLCATPMPAAAPASPAAPPTLRSLTDDVAIDQHLGNAVPADALLTDQDGRHVLLGEYLHRRPLLLVMVSYKCRLLCPMLLSHLVHALNGTMLAAGKDFDVLAIGLDPRESPDDALATRHEYVRQYLRGPGGRGDETGWHFLVGDVGSINRIEKAVGFRTAFDPTSGLYAHAGGAMVLSPRGVLTHYFFGSDFVPADLRTAVEQAAAGTVSRPAPHPQQVYCFAYDPGHTRIGLIVTRLLRVSGGGTLLALGSYMAVMFWRDGRRATAGPIDPQSGDLPPAERARQD